MNLLGFWGKNNVVQGFISWLIPVGEVSQKYISCEKITRH